MDRQSVPLWFWWLLLPLAIFSSLILYIWVPLFDWDEGAFSAATSEMFLRGDFISPYLNGEPRYDKPIGIYWLQALSIQIFGHHPWAFRLPSVLATVFWFWVVFTFVKRVEDKNIAFISGFLLITSLGISLIGRAATADAWLNLLLVLTLVNIYCYFKTMKNKYLYRVYLWMAIGFLFKGPVAVVIPFIVSFIFFHLQRTWIYWWRAAFFVKGWLIWLLIALPWYIVEYQREGFDFIEGFFGIHNIGRFVDSMEDHSGGWWYYLLIIWFLVLPYSTWLITSIVKSLKEIKNPMNQFLWIWFLFVLVFFSLATTKLPHYLLYGITPLFILMARYPATNIWWTLIPLWICFSFLLFLPDLLHHALIKLEDAYTIAQLEGLKAQLDWQYYLFVIIGLIISTVILWLRNFKGWHDVILLSIIWLSIFYGALMPRISNVMTQPIYEAAIIAKDMDNVVTWKIGVPSFSVYRQAITENRYPQRGDTVLTKTKYLNKLDNYKTIYEKHGVSLVTILE